ncbi:MAG TPA: type II toxin-antitoxin system VapC family toxin [Acidobacteriaceae bacterium]|nr:type II toxin-antitoxin system VapC family toxin [Acidobacteriaceae bacterium]
MKQQYLLDTNTISYIVKGRSQAARSRLKALNPHDVCISCITEGELIYGLEKSGDEHRRRVIDWFLASLRIQPWGREAAAAYGALRAQQERLGRPLEPLDMQIAAHAVALGAVLVTHDQAFQHVQNLPGIEDWATDL